MKKTMFIIAACAFAAVSCQKEMAVENGTCSEGILTVTANIAQFGADTKTSIDGTATTIRPLWKEGDEIKLFATDGASAVYVLNAEDAGKASGTFTIKDQETPLSGTFACAYYPAANATAYTDGTGITATIPDTQAYAANSFANGAFPMVGTGTLDAAKANLDLTFKNVFGLVQLNFTGSETISKIDLVSKKTLNGTATIKADGSCSTKIANGNKQVSLSFETPVTLTGNETSFYIAVPADSTVSRVYVTTSTASPASTSLLYKARDITASRSQIKSLNSATLTDAGFTAIPYSEATNISPVVAAGTVWAPVNCGYEPATTDPEYKGYPYGKLYQWGRKYGQGYYKAGEGTTPTYEDADYPGKSGGQQSLESLTSALTTHPDGATYNGKFYYGKTNWYGGTTPAADDLWKEDGSTDYNPCPAGWRVPTKAELKALMGSHTSGALQDGASGTIYEGMKGKYFDGSATAEPTGGVFLPAAGYRICDGGSADNRGGSGRYWSSSVNGSNSWYLSFYDSKASLGSKYRAYGYSVRCVQK